MLEYRAVKGQTCLKMAKIGLENCPKSKIPQRLSRDKLGRFLIKTNKISVPTIVFISRLTDITNAATF